MLWIKRNLSLAIGGLVTLLLLGGGLYLLFGGLRQNKAVEEAAETQVRDKKRVYTMTPYPSTTNIAEAQKELTRLREALAQTQKFFLPVPFQSVSNEEFKTHLDIQVAQLRQRAETANTQLPKKGYAFSFEAEKEALSMPAYSFPALCMQLAEVEAIVAPLLDSKVNALGFIRRPRITGVEPGQDDYHSLRSITNDATKMIMTPYEVRFFAFSGNLAQILEAYYKSDYGIVVKAVAVEETAGLETMTSSTGEIMLAPPGRQRPPPRYSRSIGERFEGEGGGPPRGPSQPVFRRPPPGSGGASSSGLTTVLDENLLKVSLIIYMMRPNPATT